MLLDAPFNRNFQTMPRRFNGLCLQAIGYMPLKSESINQIFSTFNYSIILSGQGSYSVGNMVFPVMAPCVITQLPGRCAAYGPAPGTTWEEIYFILPSEKFKALETRGLLGENPYGWPIRNEPSALRAIRELLSIIENPAQADRIDHLAERVIMETVLPGEESTDPASEAVAALAQSMTAAPQRIYDFKEVSRDYGVSYSTFQRRWRELHTEPPGQFLLSLRISESCRLLAETGLGIAVIGERMGFEDPGYFSRIFRQRIGMPPSGYRALHRPG